MSRKRMRAPRAHVLGLTLMDSVLALFVFVIGVGAVFGMLSRVSTANRRMMYLSSSLDAFARVSAEIRDAKCYFPAETPGNIGLAVMDPGFLIGAGWIETAQNSSIIEHIGDLKTTVPNLHVSYRVTAEAVQPNQAPAMDIDVRVREIMNDPRMDDPVLEDGYWIQTFPVKKMCNPRADASARGEY